MKKLLESFDRIAAEAAEPTNTDGYFAGYGSKNNELYGKPQPKNPHPAGSPAAKNWDFDQEQGRRDRWQEMGESEVDEATNHMGEREYSSFAGWRSACKKAGAEWFDGDRDIAQAMKGPRPYVRGETISVGDWDGDVGVVYNLSEELDDPAPMVEDVDDYSNGAILAKLSKVIQSCRTHDQLDGAVEMAAKADALINKRIQKSAGFGGIRRSLGVMAAIENEIKDKRRELDAQGITETEELDEISGSTLGSYIQKARADARSKFDHGNELDNDPKVVANKEKIRGWYDDRRYTKSGDSVHRSKIDKARANIEDRKKKIDPDYPKSVNGHKRLRGVDRAVDKLRHGKLTDSVTESKVGTGVTVILNESVKFRVSDPKLAKILRRFAHETENFNQGGELDDGLYDALFDYYSDNAEIPYGIAKARTGDPYEWISKRLAHEMQSAQPEIFEDVDTEIDAILSRYPHEAKIFKETGELKDDLFDALYDHYSSSGEMPYGVMKARDGDPYEWIADRLDKEIGGVIESEDPYAKMVGDGEAVDEAVDVDETLLMELSEADRLRITDELQELGLDEGLDFFFEGGHLIVIGRSTARMVINKVGGYIQSIDGEEVRIGPTPKESPQANRADVAQLATVDDGMEEAFDPMTESKRDPTGAWMAVDGDKAKKFLTREGAKKYIAKNGGKLMSIEAYERQRDEKKKVDESAAVTVQSDCDDELVNVIRKLSGLPAQDHDETAVAVIGPDVEIEETVDEPEEGLYSNEPDPEVHTSTEKMMSSGDDLNRVKRQYPNAANRGANPMAESRKLIIAYNELLKGIKK